MVKKLVLITALSSRIAFCQSNTVACGGEASGSGGTVSYSVGQIDYMTVDNNSEVITQGVQQPAEIFDIDVNSADSYQTSINAVVFPNPSSKLIHLKISDYDIDGLYYRLYNFQGKIVLEAKLNTDQTSINLENLSAGSYYLNIQKEGQILKNFKLIKH
ncbi:hypothetical protein DNU06_03195 [Putridiphycobacter roseus]|uniref:Secretion system C-terminal sorting domain-containing protein n=1 Tax=Putridiphycobacter roseus TaxID=2219161 RepID=A0A2W1N5I4_9FLAO|nr:T9SS type A sorting domain-containing protein [Putridiphycobacter roseus]PZE18850.1 hypothetical protein DNU06_03195 [Putridiphycobacter roseus]